MLLLHQAGSLKIGEVVRYTVTYTPAHDRILPSPSRLHLKIKNTSAIALRAAFVHGPYTLYAAAYPSTFHPNTKFENPRRDGVPEFEPNLKAGGSFQTELVVPEDVRKTAGSANRDGRSPGRDELDVKSVSWIIEVSSQVIFSNSAAVHYEVLLGRDEKSLSLGFANGALMGGGTPTPGQVRDHQMSRGARDGPHNAQPRGIYSKAIRLKVDDTASLWNTPKMPERDDVGERERAKARNKDAPVEDAMGKEDAAADGGHRNKRQKKVHLVVLTHGLHSNLGADMLFLKESIDATAKKAREDAKGRRARERQEAGKEEETEEDDDSEEVMVRGFSGNAVRTERGIKYLGKRLAKYVLTMTYPDQPYLPTLKKSAAEALTHALKPETKPDEPTSNRHTVKKEPYQDRILPYKFTSISFIAHSLGGLIQTYAVAYIQKHSPEFFDIIQPINFIALATPFLGLSNENPLYVKFALDFGLVGRTGQDLGLTWRAPTIARSGWGAIVGSIGESAHKRLDGESAPEAKPLLRILPTGPAHIVLKKFRNRTVYSNVVNDGIVPLRTSCLLFLDWQSLGRVEKARRENGLVGTMAEWGWSEITGANSSSPRTRGAPWSEEASDAEDLNTPTRQGRGEDVPQPPSNITDQDDARSLKSVHDSSVPSPGSDLSSPTATSFTTINNGALSALLGFFRPNPSPKSYNHEHKHIKIYKRSQTLKIGSGSESPEPGKATTGDSDVEDSDRLSAPPKTTFFESAGDVLKPPLPPVEFLIDPSSRPRAIFHDRVYHPSDIPPAPLKRRPTHLIRKRTSFTSEPTPGLPPTDSSLSSRDYDDTKNTNPTKDPREVVDGSAMKVEEKIARAYHKDLSWRKVLVRLEPDAHNNMIVRRMFANAYGWPVINHLCETHFSDAAVAVTRDEDESNRERVKGENEGPDEGGGDTKDSSTKDDKEDPRLRPINHGDRTNSEKREAADNVPALNAPPRPGSLGKALATSGVSRAQSWRGDYSGGGYDSSTGWSERDWGDSEGDSDYDTNESGRNSGEEKDKNKLKGKEKEKEKGKQAGWNWTEAIVGRGMSSPRGTDKKEVEDFLEGSGSGKVSPEEGLKSDAAAATLLSGEQVGMVSGVGGLSG